MKILILDEDRRYADSLMHLARDLGYRATSPAGDFCVYREYDFVVYGLGLNSEDIKLMNLKTKFPRTEWIGNGEKYIGQSWVDHVSLARMNGFDFIDFLDDLKEERRFAGE